jgi:hypothetical protein
MLIHMSRIGSFDQPLYKAVVNLCRKMMHSALGYALEWNERLRGPMQRSLQLDSPL